jgi:conjugal transfer pilus assembly protein TraF
MNAITKILVTLFMISTVAYAAEPNKKDFWTDRERGWYWYEIPPVEEESSKDNSTSQKSFKKPAVDWQAVWNMHPQDFSKLIDDVKHYAIMYPTPENVQDYLKMQSVAIDRSKAFMNAATMVSQTNPDLSRESTFPVSTVGQNELHRQRQAKIDSVLQDNREYYALLYFYSPTCSACTRQTPILEMFEQETGWNIKPVDVNAEQSAAVRFGIESTPTLIMIDRNSPNWILIGSAILSLPEIKERLVRSIENFQGMARR